MMTFIPRSQLGDAWPLDLDGSERITRMSSVRAVHAFPNISGYFNLNGAPTNAAMFMGDKTNAPVVGLISGILRQLDQIVIFGAQAKPAFGPSSYPYPPNLQYQITVPGLTKQG